MKPSEYALDDPIVAIATALVPAALGIIRTSGAHCILQIAPLFSNQEKIKQAQGNTIIHGWLYDLPITNKDRKKLDEVVLSVYKNPRSFTGEDSVEITCHGGPTVVLSIFRSLVAQGFRPAERGEFALRAFVNGKTDLTRAEAIKEIIESHTNTGKEHALRRLAGNLATEIQRISSMIVTALAAIEVEIEYPEDEQTTKGAFDAEKILQAEQSLIELAQTWASEKLFQDGARVVLAGKTNAGKSSLFNTLLKEDRAIVSEIHGTTRDWLESSADFEGIPVNLYDTAGLRISLDSIETQGINRSKMLTKEADLILYLVDSSIGLDAQDIAFLSQKERPHPPVVVVWNKVDSDTIPAHLTTPPSCELVTSSVHISAKHAKGIEQLVSASAAAISRGIPDGGTRIASLGSERQKVAVMEAKKALAHARLAAEEGFPLDAIGQDLEDAIRALGEITGEVTSDDILDTVFSGFCVGK